jgi:hypothetical protein
MIQDVVREVFGGALWIRRKRKIQNSILFLKNILAPVASLLHLRAGLREMRGKGLKDGF